MLIVISFFPQTTLTPEDGGGGFVVFVGDSVSEVDVGNSVSEVDVGDSVSEVDIGDFVSEVDTWVVGFSGPGVGPSPLPQ